MLIAEQGGQVSCTVGQEKDLRWVQDYVTERTSWMADRLAELKAAEVVLMDWTQNQEKRQQLRGQRIYWETESRNGLKFLKHRARNKVVQEWAAKVASRDSELKAELIPLWIGDKGLTTEESSHSTDEWGLDEEHLQQLLQEFQIQPTVDGFASHLNTRCQKFYSKTGQPGRNFVERRNFRGVRSAVRKGENLRRTT
jgi:hypothetical protein